MTSKPTEPRAADPGAVPADLPGGAPDTEVSVAQLKAESAEQRRRIKELEAEVARGRAARPADTHPAHSMLQRESVHRLLSLLNYAPTSIFIKDVNFRYVVVNRQFAESARMTPDEFVGFTDHDFLPHEMAEMIRSGEERVIASGQPSEYEEEMVSPEGEPCTFYTVKFPVFDPQGSLIGVGGFITDITERKRLEAERITLKEQVISSQQAALRELSTPLVPLAKGVLVMPIVGTIDRERAQGILETLLEGISQKEARIAIIDITGVRGVDIESANALVRAARAARLLGTHVVLTGVSPSVAQTLVELGADMSDILTLGTLASGIAHAFKR